MPKVGMEPLRRRQIIAATKACIHREGIARASASRIAREAGIAPGLIMHYFADKDALLLETFRSIYREFTTDIRRRLGLAQSPAERMMAILEAQIAPESLTPEAVYTWFAIYSTMRDFPLLERIERDYDRRLLSNLVHALRGMGFARPEAREIAEELGVFIDGLWQNLANPVTLSPERARALLHRYLRARLPGVDLAMPVPAPAPEAEVSALSPEARTFLAENLPVMPMQVGATGIHRLRQKVHQRGRLDGKAAVRALGLGLRRRRLGGIDTLAIAPRGEAGGLTRALVLYLSGGLYVTGEPETSLPVSGALAARLGATVLAPRCRLAPEHPAPAAFLDALAACRAASAEAPFVMVGEAAGGGLALAVLQAMRREGLRLPAAVALISPWVDLTHALPSANDGLDPTLTRRNLLDAARLAAGPGGDPGRAELSPLHGDLAGLPPVLIATGGRDILREQALALAEGIAAAGGTVDLDDRPGLWHGFQAQADLPEGARALDRIAGFLRAAGRFDEERT